MYVSSIYRKSRKLAENLACHAIVVVIHRQHKIG